MMNKLNYLLLTGIVIGFVALAGCGDDSAPSVDPVEEVTKRFSKTWVVDADNPVSKVMYGTEDRTDKYDNFRLTVNANNSYSTNSGDIDDPTPWPAGGNWEFTNEDNITDPEDNSFSITRSDDLEITVNLSENSEVLEMTFNFNPDVHDGSRVDGNWTFVMVAQ